MYDHSIKERNQKEQNGKSKQRQETNTYIYI
jgi:hypothetical protein